MEDKTCMKHVYLEREMGKFNGPCQMEATDVGVSSSLASSLWPQTNHLSWDPKFPPLKSLTQSQSLILEPSENRRMFYILINNRRKETQYRTNKELCCIENFMLFA